MYSFYVQRE